jgi:hypothetical protein
VPYHMAAETCTVDQNRAEVSVLDKFGYGSFERADVLHVAEISANYSSVSASGSYRPCTSNSFLQYLLLAEKGYNVRPVVVAKGMKIAHKALVLSRQG